MPRLQPGYTAPQGASFWAITGGRLLLPDRIVDGHALVIEGSRILGLAAPGDLPADLPTVDAGGRWVTPGLIDVHTHGALGHSFNEADPAAWRAIAELQAGHGVTSLLATLAAAPLADMVACLDAAAAFVANQGSNHKDTKAPSGLVSSCLCGSDPLSAQIVGVHLEGPYLSPAQKGALDPASLRTPDDGTADALLARPELVRVLTLAPELPGAAELCARLGRLGIVPAAGHSAGCDTHVRACIDAGLRHTVHIWSGQSTTVREGPWRRPGLLEATLAFPELTAEMIADNKHLPVTLMRLAYQCKGADRLCAISDATNGAGLPEGAHFRMGAMEYDVHDGVAMLLDRTAFAGSTTLLNQMISILTDVVGIPLVEAVRMATLTPARIIGLADRKGALTPGMDADVAVFEQDWTCWGTAIGGRWTGGNS